MQLVWTSYYVRKIPHADNLAGSFWWRDVMKLVDNFRAVSSVTLGKGDTFLFWLDNWKTDLIKRPLKDRFPRLFSFVLDDNISAAEVFATHDKVDLFHLPLSQQAHGEFLDMLGLLEEFPTSESNDIWTYSWGKAYTSAQFYSRIHRNIYCPKVFHWLWKSACTMSMKMFAWLLIRDRLNTKDLIKRRHWRVTEDYTCASCPTNSYEDREHLFFTCNFSQRVWNYLQVVWTRNADIQVSIAYARKKFSKPFFMEVVIVACRHIWLQRNGKIFNHQRPSFTKWKNGFVHDLTLLTHRMKKAVREDLDSWIALLP